MSLKILVVDDDFINRKLLTVILKKFDNVGEILEACDGEEALAMLDKHPDVGFILLDIVMPKMNGFEFLQVRRDVAAYNEIPVIVLSTDDARKGLVLEEGANSFLLKPLKEEVLFREIRNLLI